MSAKPKITFCSLSTAEAVDVAWNLKRITETHSMRQQKLVEEYRQRADALTNEMQEEQSAAFESLRNLMGLSDADWAKGALWALNIENLADGTVALVHESDESRQGNNCNCPVCQLNRLFKGDDTEEQPVTSIFH